MTKLNYINRKIDGLKLGQVVARDLRKRFKPSNKQEHFSPIDLNLEGKDLTDQGLAEVAHALEDVLVSADHVIPPKLQVLNLSSNALSVHSLALLAPSIRAAAADLEDLDLAKNSVTVESRHDIEDWETFLHSFQGCTSLRRLNLSGNNLEGCVPFEVFARVYCRQFQVDTTIWEKSKASNDSGKKVAQEEEDFTSSLEVLSVRDTNLHTPLEVLRVNNLSNETHAKAVGLPSVRCIGLLNCQITDPGSLFLSYIIERHRWTQNTLCSQIWGAPEEGHAMIVTTPNEKLTPAGTRSLKLAEAVPYHPFGSLRIEQGDSPLRSWVGHGQLEWKHNQHEQHSRRSSGTQSSHESSHRSSPLHNMTSSQELDALRRKIQRGMIENQGYRSVDIWMTALKMLPPARVMFVETEYPINFPPLGQGNVTPEASPERQVNSSTPRRTTAKTYASTLTFDLSRREPGFFITGESQRPVTPQVLRRHQRQNGSSAGSESRHNSSTPSSRARAPSLKGVIGIDRPDPKVVNGWPVRVLRQILVEMADPDRLLSNAQIDAVIAYAGDRATLGDEIGSRGKTDSIRIWRILEAIGCLVYDDEI